MKTIYKFWLCWVVLIALTLPLQAPVAAAAATPTFATFGTVYHLRGEVIAKSKTGDTRQLKPGDLVYVGEQLRSSAASEAVIKTKDAGIVAIRPNSECIMERYAANGKATDHQILKLVTGSLRVISGWIGQINREQHRIVTPGATIGIRGTDHEPYVLPVVAGSSKFSPGTYDKVNRGQTVLDANGSGVDITKGRVGYARDPAAGKRQRAMLTLLMPVLLDAVPEFYTGGNFELELDEYSAAADESAQQALSALQITDAEPSKASDLNGVTQATVVALVSEPVALAESVVAVATDTLACPARALGLAWLDRLDAAIAQREAAAILDLFASDVAVTAIVISGGKPSTLTFTRNQMVQSTLKSIASLKDYQQRRESNIVTLGERVTASDCNKLRVRSTAIEQGLMNGRSFRFEAVEEYDIEKRPTGWQAVSVQTTQQ